MTLICLFILIFVALGLMRCLSVGGQSSDQARRLICKMIEEERRR